MNPLIKLKKRQKEEQPFALENGLLEKQVKKRLKGPMNLLLVILWVGILFSTHLSQTYKLGIHAIFLPLKPFFIVHEGRGFPGIEVICIIFFILLFWLFRDAMARPRGIAKAFFWLSFCFVLLALINPKNYYTDIFKFLSFRITRTILVYLLITFVIMFLKTKVFAVIVTQIFRVGIIVGLVKGAFDLLSFVSRTGIVNDYGRRISSFGGEILSWYAIFHIFLFSIYLFTRKNKYLYQSAVFFLCTLFSYQRSPLFLILMADAGLIAVAASKLKRTMRSLLKIGFSFIAVMLVIIIVAGQGFFLDLLSRHGAALEFTGLVDVNRGGTYKGYTDSGHFEQSMAVTRYFLANSNNFWGGGLNRRDENYLFIEGQSEGGVHSNLASLWQFFGLPGVAYFAILVLITLLFLYTAFIGSFLRSFENFICLTGTIYLIARFITGWFAGDFFFMYLQLGLQIILMFSIFKIYRHSVFRQNLNLG